MLGLDLCAMSKTPLYREELKQEVHMSFVSTLKNVVLLKLKQKSIKGVILYTFIAVFAWSSYVSCTKKGMNVFLDHFRLIQVVTVHLRLVSLRYVSLYDCVINHTCIHHLLRLDRWHNSFAQMKTTLRRTDIQYV